MLDLATAMNRMPIDNEKHLTIGLFYQTSEKLDHHIGFESTQHRDIILNYLLVGDSLLSQQFDEPPNHPAQGPQDDQPNDFKQDSTPADHSDRPPLNFHIEPNLKAAVENLQLDVGIRIIETNKGDPASPLGDTIECELIYASGSRRLVPLGPRLSFDQELLL